jgi:hypothetical protein
VRLSTSSTSEPAHPSCVETVRLRVDRALTVPKDAERPDLNEDAWAADEAVTRIALSDGASESFDSRTWANLLVNAYALNPAFSSDWLTKVLGEYLESVDYESLSWSKQAAFDRGSFATLLGVELAPNGSDIEVLALGDSVAFHVRSDSLLVSFPYTTPEEFDARPLLLSTVAASNSFVTESGFFSRNSSSTWSIETGDLILVATDAVSQWVLNEHKGENSALSFLSIVDCPELFETKIKELRFQRRIKVDDSTMIRLVVEG